MSATGSATGPRVPIASDGDWDIDDDSDLPDPAVCLGWRRKKDMPSEKTSFENKSAASGRSATDRKKTQVKKAGKKRGKRVRFSKTVTVAIFDSPHPGIGSTATGEAKRPQVKRRRAAPSVSRAKDNADEEVLTDVQESGGSDGDDVVVARVQTF